MKQIPATPKAMTTRVHSATATMIVISRIFVGGGVDDMISVVEVAVGVVVVGVVVSRVEFVGVVVVGVRVAVVVVRIVGV